MTILAVFRSRAQTLDYVAALKNAGIPASAVATPKEAGVGCGISAKFEENFFCPRPLFSAKKTVCVFFRLYAANGG